MSIRNQVMGAAGAASGSANYIEDVFSTYLYTGNGAAQTINNGIDLAGKGGLQWGKLRSGSDDHYLTDTVRGTGYYLYSDGTYGNFASGATGINAFTSTGYTLGSGSYQNTNGSTYASWTFRKQPKFFDVVTYTGTGTIQTIAHNLGSAPGCIIVKKTSGVSNWAVYHRSTGNTEFMSLNLTNASATLNFWGDTDPTSTQFTVNGYQAVGDLGGTYVAYLFAHNAGGFGATGTDNVVSCGSFTTDAGGNATVNLGYEPQWVLIKRSDSTGNWLLMDSMRGMPVTANSTTTTGGRLYPNLSAADDGYPSVIANATGFITVPGTVPASATFIYIAIRRGPMKVPTDGTKVFAPFAVTASGTDANNPNYNAGFPVDFMLRGFKSGNASNAQAVDRLRGGTQRLATSSTASEDTTIFKFDSMLGPYLGFSSDSTTIGAWNFRRAPGFFDEVCYTGTGTFTTPFAHNLTVTPELVIVKARTTTGQMNWYVCQYGVNKYGQLTTAAFNPDLSTYAPVTSTTFVPILDISGANYVTYLFATCPGVSKVGSYTGTGATQTIPCGFAGGARFVLVKRTDSTGDWYVWDSARGIVAGNDPHLSLNSTAAEVTSNDSVDPVSTGFIVNQVAATNINVSGATYIFLAIA